MDGRRPTGVMYVNTHVDDPNKEIEYDAWYRNVHFPDVTEPGMFVNATMFHNANVPPATGEGKFLAFYETYWEDVGAATDAFRGWVDVLGRESRIHAGTLERLVTRERAIPIPVVPVPGCPLVPPNHRNYYRYYL